MLMLLQYIGTGRWPMLQVAGCHNHTSRALAPVSYYCGSSAGWFPHQAAGMHRLCKDGLPMRRNL